MVESFLTIVRQVVVVFLLMAVGFAGGKKKLISDTLADGLAGIALNISIPASILLAFQREFETRLLRDFLLSVVLAAAGYVLFITIAWLTIRDEDSRRKNTLRFTAVFANCAMVALPLQSAM
ncbi:MAG: AEC family transporter, partial [Oscillospiraceae bacterium]|nr:AEC family transporter [Oscillospiraceae bacterium]